MLPDPQRPDLQRPDPYGAPVPTAPADLQPGLMMSICSIVAGVVGYFLPLIGVVGSVAAIWLGIKGMRLGRVANYNPSVICGIIGIAVGGVGLFFFVLAILFFGGIVTLIGSGAMTR